MAKEEEWKSVGFSSGIAKIECSTIKGFTNYIEQVLTNYKTYIFRGQDQEQNWPLIPKIYRRRKEKPKELEIAISKHLREFKRATRGRRGSNPRSIIDENEWWALGQHYGLDTPLLDWTESPFIALFFAFLKEQSEVGPRIVFALSERAIRKKSDEINEKEQAFSRSLLSILLKNQGQMPSDVITTKVESPDTINIIRPQTDENPNLVSQKGLFTRSPSPLSIEEWVKKHFKKSSKSKLIKIKILDTDREGCLRFLNRMNINYQSLFPDLRGASRYCNNVLEIENY